MGSLMTQQVEDDNVSSDHHGPTLLLSLMEAQRLASELKACLQQPLMDTVPLAAGGAGDVPALVERISESLSRAIMRLPQSPSIVPAPAPAPARRASGGYKRRTELSQRCRKEVRSSIEDGYSWRKYGQKDILAAKYPRSYFRCKHKYEQLCPATRQVQRSEEDPSMLEITYIGDHTCCAKRQDVLSPVSTGVGPDHGPTYGGAPPVQLDLDGAFPFATASDLQMAFDDVMIFDDRWYSTDDTYCTVAAAGDDELAAAASSPGAFTAANQHQ